MNVRTTIRRWHLWIGWVIGVPMLLWTVSGLVMAWKPIDEVRGADLLREPPALNLTTAPVPPAIDGLNVTKLAIEPRAAGPRWVIETADGTSRWADPASGALLPRLSAADAAREVTSRYTGTARLASVSRTSKAEPPLDLRRPVDAWRVEMSDGTRFYVDQGNGAVVARRTRWWRFYDLMWGLHIMDLQTREDTSNGWLFAFALIAALSTVLALVLLPLSTKRKKRRSAQRGAEQAG